MITRNSLNRGDATSSALPGPFAWDDLPVSYPSWKPVLLDSGVVVAFDPRTGLWVPYYLRNYDLLTSWHKDTFNPASLPTGWASVGTVGGSTTGGLGADVVIATSAVPGAYWQLYGTLPETADKEIVSICYGDFSLTGTAAGDYSGLAHYDKRINKLTQVRYLGASDTTEIHNGGMGVRVATLGGKHCLMLRTAATADNEHMASAKLLSVGYPFEIGVQPMTGIALAALMIVHLATLCGNAANAVELEWLASYMEA